MKLWGKIRNKKTDITALIILAVICILIFSPVIYERRGVGDLGAHASIAKRYYLGGRLESPDFLYQALIILTHSIFPFIGFFSSGVVVMVASYIVFCVVLYCYLRPLMGEEQSPTSSSITIILVITLMFIAPITFFTWKDHNLYYGYIPSNVYHNPTSIIVRPLSLLLFITSLKIFHWEPKKKESVVFLLALLVLLSAICKPSYLICILPALIIFSAYQYYSKQKINWKFLILGVLVPGTILLGIQYFGTYVPNVNLIDYQGGNIIFTPLAVMTQRSSWLFPKFLLSILFPVSVCIAYFKKVQQSTALSLSWFTFFFGSFYTYMMAESENFNDGNFLWSGQISLLILFISSLKFFILQIKESIELNGLQKLGAKPILNLGVLVLHFICGIPWYFVYFIGNDNFR